MFTQSSTIVDGAPNATFAVAVPEPMPVVVVAAVAVLVRDIPLGNETGPYVHCIVAPGAMVVDGHVTPTGPMPETVSVTATPFAATGAGLVTLIVPDTDQPLSVPPSFVTTTE